MVGSFSTTPKTGRFTILEQLLADDITHIFGNPGTVEQGFLDALWQYPDLRYILTLQETIAILIADGYARATQQPTVVQIHSTPGLGNAIGAMYQAKRGHSPLVVIGGDAGIQYQSMDAQMAGDLVAMAEPVTKWATMVQDPRSLLRVLRRAIKIAATPPMGPVYVCLPQDILDAVTLESVRPTGVPSTRVVPEESLLRRAAMMLAAAAHPMIYVGDGVAYSGAQAEVAQVAELLGAEVWSADAGEINIPLDHPLYMGSTGHMFGYQSLPTLQKGDVSLICGTYVLPEVFPEIGDIFATGAQTIHIDLNAYEIGKNHPVDIGLVADPKLTLARMADLLRELMTPVQQEAAKSRTASLTAAKQTEIASQRVKDIESWDHRPLHMVQFAEALGRLLPDNAVVFDEALTNSPPLSRYLRTTEPGSYFLTRGGSLGVGIPGAVGVKLAYPDRPVWGFTGDGGAMYTIQALWTAARHNVDAKFVICNNSSYRLLQLNIQAYWTERNISLHEFPLSFDLSKPAIQFAQLAQAMGVDAIRVEASDQIEPAIQKALEHPGPFLIDLVLEGNVHPELIGVHCGQ
jgi:thiamine pyrophosphate-dependent acetolactate synthase large subunit-like protein